jgi:NCS1 nucleoside transporter family
LREKKYFYAIKILLKSRPYIQNKRMSQTKTASLYSEDLAPVPGDKGTWNTWNYAALWISMSLCIPTYMLASSLIEGGMNWWQSILTIFLGNVVVLIPMILNGHAGAKYGIPFPVFARASFGTRGANIPAMLRAIVSRFIWFADRSRHYIFIILAAEYVGGLSWSGKY